MNENPDNFNRYEQVRRRYDALVAPYADGGEVALPVAEVLASGVAPNS